MSEGSASGGRGDRVSVARRRLVRTLRIARWEVSTSAGTIDRTTVVALVVLAAIVGTVGATAIDDGPGLEDEIYLVGVDEDDPYHEVAAAGEQFRPVDPDRADADVSVSQRGEIEPSDSATNPKSEPAYDAFRDAIEAHNDDLMAAEDDEAAAYPVRVTLEYQDREPGDRTSASPDGPGDGGGSDGANGGDGGGDSTDGGERSDGDDGSDDENLQVPDVGGGTEGLEAGTPGAISPPFPFRSLVLAFLFVVPMNFVIQAYGSTIMDERLKRRGELLLVSPASRHEIVAGKTLPYFCGLVGVAVAIAVAIDGGVASVAAAIPIALLFLSATFVGAMFARSFKELTFVTVAVSVFLTTYTFVPAIFTDVTPVALISPLSIVVMDLEGSSIAAGEYLFSTGPFYLGSVVLFLLGIGIYREEDMFAQKPIPAKAIDAVASRVRGYWSVPLLSILFIPFVFAGELLVVALLFALPLELSLPVLFLAIAAIEELAKSVHVYAGFATSRFEASLRSALVLGALAGTGFFVGEKLTHVVQFVGLPDLAIGRAAFGPALSTEPIVLVALFFAPLVLHVVTAIVSAIGASRGRTGYAIGFLAATVLHAAYNAGVTSLVA